MIKPDDIELNEWEEAFTREINGVNALESFMIACLSTFTLVMAFLPLILRGV